MSYHILTFDGKLVGVTPIDWVSLPGVSVITMEGEIPDLNKVTWDEDAQEFVTIGTALTKLEFRRLFTAEEQMAVDKFNTSFESYEWLTPAQKDAIRSGLEDYKYSQDIRLDDPKTILMLQMYVGLGFLTIERLQEVLS